MTGHKIIKYIVELTQAEMELTLHALKSTSNRATDPDEFNALADLEESFSALLNSPQ